MPKLIDEEYRAFVSGRSIFDNILLLQETFCSISHSTKRRLLMDLKVDKKRVYDRMSWNFVVLVLKKFGLQNSLLIGLWAVSKAIFCDLY